MAEDDWIIAKPVDHIKIGDVPQKIRDVKASVKVIISKEHVTPSTDNAGGQHLKGAARVYLSDAVAVLDPELNSLDTTETTDDGRIHVNTTASNELRVYIATAAGIYTGWTHVRVGRVKAAEDLDANAFAVKNLASGTQAGEAIQIAQIDTTVSTGQLKLLTPSTDSKIAVAVLDPPTEDGHIVSKKYTDAQIRAIRQSASETEEFNTTAPTTFTDLDLPNAGGAIPEKACLVLLSVSHGSASDRVMSFRKNGSAFTSAALTVVQNEVKSVWVETDASGIIEWKMSVANEVTITSIAYITL